MKKILIGILIGLGLTTGTAYAVTVFHSNQVGSAPSNGKILQTNGTDSTWVATSTLGISGGVTNVTGSGNIASSGGATPNITFTGILPLANGGINTSTTPTVGQLLVGNASSNYSLLPIGSTGQVLTVVGGNAAWAAATGSTASIFPLIANGTVAGVNATSSTVSFNIQGSTTLNPFNVASSSGTSFFQITSGGNVKIGTTSASSILLTDSNNNITSTSTPLPYSLGGTNTTTPFQTISFADLSLGGSNLSFGVGDGKQILIGTSTTITLTSTPTFGQATFTGVTSLATSTIVGSFSLTGTPTFSGVSNCNGLQFLQITSGLFGCGTPTGGGGGAGGGWATTTAPGFLAITNTSGTAVGINTTTPSGNLVVVGISGSTTPQLLIASSSGASEFSVTASQIPQLVIGTTTSTTLANFYLQGTSASSSINLFTVASSTGVNIFNIAANGSTTLSSLSSGIVRAINGELNIGKASLTADITGVLPVANGGTATSTAPTQTNQLLGDDGTHKYAPVTLIQGSNITISTSTAGQITISSTNGGGGGSSGAGFSTSSPQYITSNFPNSTTALVGINSSTPTAILTVMGISGSSTPQLLVASSTGSSSLIVTSGGKVGIGSSSPAGLLVLNAPSGASGSIFSIQNNNSPYLDVTTTGGVDINNASLNIGTSQGEGAFLSVINLSTGGVISFNNGFSDATLQNNGAFAGSGFTIKTNNTTGDIKFLPNGVQSAAFTGGGNTALGTTTSVTRLSVTGSSAVDPFNISSTSGTSLLYVTKTGNLGIGTTTPPANLTVVGVSASANSLFQIASSTGATSLIVLANGNVGINTSSPTALLSIQGFSASSLDLLRIASSTNAYIFGVDSDGHKYNGGTAPTFSACGTSPNPSVVGDDSGGTITVGGGVITSCAMTFNIPFKQNPVCTFNDDSTASVGDISAISTSSVTFGFSVSLTAGHIYYNCSYHKP